MKRPKRNQAFSLTELLLVIAIITTLMAIVIPRIAGFGGDAKIAAAKAQIGHISSALNMYEIHVGDFPRDLQSLVDQPGNAQGWRGPYLDKEVPLDPWGNAYIYEYPGKHKTYGFDLSSAGPDGKAGTDDDITNW